ncbi:MAG: hypothetical protein WD009_06440 [Phycisphaeraceae bacterium]
MAENREIRQRVRVDNEASVELQRVADDTRAMGDATKGAGEQAEQASEGQERLVDATQEGATATREHEQESGFLSGTLGKLTAGVAGVVGGWLSFNAIAGTVVSWLQSINKEAEKAEAAQRSLGDSLRELALNLGDATDPFVAFVDGLDSVTSATQRGTLLDFATVMTDRRPELVNDPQALQELTRQVAPLPLLLPNVSGEQLANTIAALEKRVDRPIETAAHLIQGGFSPDDIERFAIRGGDEALMLAFATQQEGAIDSRQARRQLGPLLDSLDRRDPDTDELIPELVDAKITTDMADDRRIQLAARALKRAEGADRQRLEQALGGRDAAILVREIGAAVDAGAVDRARQEVKELDIAEMRARQRSSAHVRRVEEAEHQELRQQRVLEQDTELGRRARLLNELETLMMEEGRSEFYRDVELGQYKYTNMRNLEDLVLMTARDVHADDPEAFEQSTRHIRNERFQDRRQRFLDEIRERQEVDGGAPSGDAGSMLPGGGGGGRSLTQVNIRNNYQGREDPAWADVEPPIGLG